jgi:DNA-binding transcriptional LysR family regulator
MDVRTLEYFLAVLEERSFTRAAQRCHIAQPSLSQQIRALEREIGFDLFERRPREVLPTAEGRLLEPHARAAVAAVEAAGAEFAFRAGRVVGAIRLGLVSGIDTATFARSIAALRQQHPDVSLDVVGGTSAQLLAEVSSGRLEAAVIANPVGGLPPHIAHDEVSHEEIVAVRARTGPFKSSGGDRLRLTDLEDVDLISYHESSGAWPHIASVFSELGIRPRIICATNDTVLQVALARAGVGVTVSASADLGGDLGPDVTVAGFDPPLRLTKILIRRRHQRPSRALSALTDLWTASAASDAADRAQG